MLRFRVLGSGSDGNATLVEGGGSRLLLDAGLGPRQLAERLQSARVDPASLEAVLVSHEHGDHARGAQAFSRRWGVPLAGTRRTFAAAAFDESRLPPLVPIAAGETRVFGRLSVRALVVPHDAAGPIAFVVSSAGASFAHATDLGHLSRGLVDALRACDAVLVESNYDPAMLRDGPYPWRLKERILGPFGHLSNADVGRLLEKGIADRCCLVVLAHLSRRNNHPELALLSASEALSRAGRRQVRLELATGDGTGWMSVGQARSGERQLKLF